MKYQVGREKQIKQGQTKTRKGMFYYFTFIFPVVYQNFRLPVDLERDVYYIFGFARDHVVINNL